MKTNLKFMVALVLTAALSGCGDDVTNNNAATTEAGGETKVQVSSASVYTIQLKDEVTLPVLSSGFEVVKGTNVCEVRSAPLLEALTFSAGTIFSLKGALASLDSKTNEALNVVMSVSGAPVSLMADCEFSSSDVEAKGFATVLSETFSAADKVTVLARKVVAPVPPPEPVKPVKSEIKFSDADVKLKKLTSGFTLYNAKVGECEIEFKNLGDVEPILKAKVVVSTDEVKFMRYYDPRVPELRTLQPQVYLYRYKAQFNDEVVSSVSCDVVVDKADQVSSAIDSILRGADTKLTKVEYF